MPPSPRDPLGDQDPGAGKPSRVILDELHVFQLHAATISYCHAVADLDRAVVGEAEDAACARWQ
jgi:hypothetical protein